MKITNLGVGFWHERGAQSTNVKVCIGCLLIANNYHLHIR